MKLSDGAFVSLILAAIVLLLVWSNALLRFDYLFYDLGHLFTFKPAPSNVVIVSVDEVSLNKVGRWPWSREVHANLIDQLSKARASVIGFDIILSEPELKNPQSDILLAQAIGRAGNVVMPIVLEVPNVGAGIKQTMPLSIFTQQAAALGRVHFPLDADGIARSLYLWEGLSLDGISAIGLPHFSQAVLQVAHLLSKEATSPPIIEATSSSALGVSALPFNTVSRRLLVHQKRKINFIGPPGHFQRVSYSKVLAGDFPINFFKEKIVLVGATAVGLGDVLPTPVSGASQPMPGVELQANAIVAMQNKQLVVDASLLVTAVACLLLALIPLTWLSKLTPLQSLLAIIGYFFIVIIGLVSLPQIMHVWISPSSALVAILLTYPLWSWRRLDSAQAFLDIELEHLRNELSLLGIKQDSVLESANEDRLQSRILKVKATADYLRELHRSRSDTLAFISHDIRAPLGAAMMLLEQQENNKYSERMRKMLGRAYAMAEGFLQASRAEMVNVNKFHGLDFVSLMQQAVDEMYEVTLSKKIKIEVTTNEASLWVRGDFGLLHRAIANILLNAINYSPEQSTIHIGLGHDAQSLCLTIQDEGSGIPEEQLPKLFKRFSRVDAEFQSREGTGLGLYFVDITIKKHGGHVDVKSQVGLGTTFLITLPIERRKVIVPVENDRRSSFKSTSSDAI
ncbi:MAG: CHASE2 domain-containing protein [Methylotenera sp.]|nr:CHASE2 domain-containing protein [Methylotenera sp.]